MWIIANVNAKQNVRARISCKNGQAILYVAVPAAIEHSQLATLEVNTLTKKAAVAYAFLKGVLKILSRTLKAVNADASLKTALRTEFGAILCVLA